MLKTLSMVIHRHWQQPQNAAAVCQRKVTAMMCSASLLVSAEFPDLVTQNVAVTAQTYMCYLLVYPKKLKATCSDTRLQSQLLPEATEARALSACAEPHRSPCCQDLGKAPQAKKFPACDIRVSPSEHTDICKLLQTARLQCKSCTRSN